MTSLLPWQTSQWQLLQQAITSKRIPHALLFIGPEGIGKRVFAKLLSNSLICDNVQDNGFPCGTCNACHLYSGDASPDIRIIEPEEQGKQIKIEAIRDLVAQSVLAVKESRYRVFLVYPADAMTNAATNALLKTLEEPVPGTLLILVSSAPDRLPATIKSRCQIVRFNKPSESDALQWQHTCPRAKVGLFCRPKEGRRGCERISDKGSGHRLG